MTAIHEGANIYSITSQSGRECVVDARDGSCTCPDAQYNLDDGDLCKHALRVSVVRGERAIPAAVDRDAIDPQLGIAVDSTPVAGRHRRRSGPRDRCHGRRNGQ